MLLPMIRLKILYIEDSPDDMLLLEKACNERGLEVDFFVLDDGQKGIHFLNLMSQETFSLPDVIIVDFTLPHKNGLEVILAIRKNQTLLDIPIILFTGREQDIAVNGCSKLGAIYIQKPSHHKKYAEIMDILSGLSVHKQWDRLNTKDLQLFSDE